MTEYEQGVNDALTYMHKILEQSVMLNQLLEDTPNYEDLMCSMDNLWYKIAVNATNKELCKHTCERLSELEDRLNGS